MMREENTLADEQVDVLFFEVGDQVYGVDAGQVLRIDRALPNDPVVEELGELKRGSRVLVFTTPQGEGHLRVDGVQGVRPVLVTDLRRMPPAVNAAAFTIGACLEQARLVLLIDLVETAKTQGRH